MTVSSKQDSPALKALMRHPQIRAVIWITPKGKVKARRGQAFCMRIGADDPTVQMPIKASSEGPDEAIYITCFADDDYLVVIFDEHADFESIKEDVDATLEAVQP